MALPKKKKIDININPPKVGREFLKYGFDRIEELMLKTDKKTVYLPRGIRLEDIDDGLYEYINTGKLRLVLDGSKVSAFYLENERWGEFEKTWKLMDSDKNVPTPYITVRRSDKDPGTRLGVKWAIAQSKTFRYFDAPILDDGQVINLRFKIPEPTNVDLTFDVRLFSKYREEVNVFDELILNNFKSRQGYIWVKGTPFPVILDGIDESNTIENIDGDRYYVGVYKLKVMGFILDEKEFEITKTTRLPRIGIDLA